ncbi:hypothetical protein KRP22_005073 [Phytophthora ramorum]|uniref:uncharacterized protein n=1 Tax=Phytophthora ramorum TaxID=164328 RepID=UPI003094E8A0|nr:hypothetical protein KRP23_8100 [Phytophthora ramorum]KAH7497595.1 hypothetical protein KRP22_12657 [Phytophthora ramorum]
MLRALLSGRGGLPHRLQATSGSSSSLVKFSSVSSTSPSIRHVRIDLWSARAWVEKIAPALQTFLAVEKHLMVPLKFVVPHGDAKWPVEAWGYPLGLHCRNLRVIKQQGKKLPFFALDDLEMFDFPWDMRQRKWEVLVLPSLKNFYEINGHSDIPNTFVVPKGDPQWPELLWGFRLGQTVMSMTYVGTYKAQQAASEDELVAIGFAAVSWKERQWAKKIMPALVAFRREFGHCNVNFNFVVPRDPKWPKASRGLRLGATVANMRCRGNYEDMAQRDKHKLEEIGFVWDPEDQRWTERIMPAFEAYRDICKVSWVPVDFAVPDEEPWPEITHGLRLGNIFMKIRHTGAYSYYIERDGDRLKALGYDFKVPYESHAMLRDAL